jgi:hypothetical protein
MSGQRGLKNVGAPIKRVHTPPGRLAGAPQTSNCLNRFFSHGLTKPLKRGQVMAVVGLAIRGMTGYGITRVCPVSRDTASLQ